MLEIWASLGADRCVVCGGGPTAPDTGVLGARLCGRCLEEVPERLSPLPVPPPGVARAWSLGPYAGALGALVRAGKFRGDEGSLLALGRCLAEGLPALDVDAVVAVPSSPWRRIWRGMNPADLLAAPIARRIGAPVSWPLVRRRAQAQARLGHAERSANVRDAYLAVAPVAGTVLLVDDVVTTGSTAAACARELHRAGAERVLLVSVAASTNGIQPSA